MMTYFDNLNFVEEGTIYDFEIDEENFGFEMVRLHMEYTNLSATIV